MGASGQIGSHGPRARHASTWLVGSAVLALALLALLWSGGALAVPPHPVDAPGAAEPVVRADGVEVLGALGGEQVVVGGAPAPLLTAATLVVKVDESGVLASSGNVTLRHQADGEQASDTRALAPSGEITWSELPPGTYQIDVDDADWILEESSITLAAGDERTVLVSPRRMVAVRVVGALTGHNVAVRAVRVSGYPAHQLTSYVTANAYIDAPTGTFALLGLPSTLPGGLAAERFVIDVRTADDAVQNEGLFLTSIETTPVLTLHMPEPAVVGRVLRADDSPDGKPRPFDDNFHVIMEPADLGQQLAAQAAARSTPPASDRQVTFYGRVDFKFGTVGPDGSYQILLDEKPTGPVRVRTSSSNELQADSGPITLPADGTPLHLDLALPAAGRVRGTVQIGSASLAAGGAGPSLEIRYVRAHRLNVPNGEFALDPVGNWDRDGQASEDPGSLAFDFPALPSGEYEVLVSLQPVAGLAAAVAARRLTGPVTVRAGQTSDVSFDALAPGSGATLSGSLRLPPGFEFASAAVDVGPIGDGSARAEPSIETRPDATGHFELDDVSLGLHAIRVQAYGEEGQTAAGYSEVSVTEGHTSAPLLDLNRPELRFRTHRRKGMRLFVSTVRNDWDFVVSTDKTGLGRTFGVGPGHYRMQDGSAAPFDFEVPANVALFEIDVP